MVLLDYFDINSFSHQHGLNQTLSHTERQRSLLLSKPLNCGVGKCIKPFTLIAAIVLTMAPVITHASGNIGKGLWSSDTTANQTDCGAYSRDLRNFCITKDGDGAGSGVELGVRFETNMPIWLTGLRIYRVDDGEIKGDLRDSNGQSLLPNSIVFGPFFSSDEGGGWQDQAFDQPVQINPGQMLIASYRTLSAKYAFEYDFFKNSDLTVGPITALQSMGDNGVYCYDNEVGCLPLSWRTYRDSNYWITPLWAYNPYLKFFNLDHDAYNSAKAGSSIPVKFSLDGDRGMDILAAGYPQAHQIACSSENVDPIEDTSTASNSGLSYDPIADQYIYVWKTNKSWAGKCFEFEMKLNDDTSHTFKVLFK